MIPILEDNTKLVTKFGAKKIVDMTIDVPSCYTFEKGLFYSHREFDTFLKKLYDNVPSAIVSGVNASGSLHLGHKPVFDTCLYFQKEYGVTVYVPISDDESYITKKVDTQEEALQNAYGLAKQLIAYGFDPKNTVFLLDQVYTNIYNYAIKLSRKVTVSEILAVYGYTHSDNPGMYFYPCIQSAHIVYPQLHDNIQNTLVIIGPDEDSHIRVGRDLASRFGLQKPSVIHSVFLPGMDGKKMSKSKNNALFFQDDEKTIQKKIRKSLSGGRETVEEHRQLGGDPTIDTAYLYLHSFFLEKSESQKLAAAYKAGEILSGELKELAILHVQQSISAFQEALAQTDEKLVDSCIRKNTK
ncbi:MAG: tryptophan--tRNA ligase [Candidatus Woesearchaeota archaeon]